jgi:hypothetical protein
LEEWEILWNAGQKNSNLYDPIQDWDSTNIQYTKMRIGRALRKCDKVLVDVPSSVMWDSKKAGKLCLCLTVNNQWLREDAFDGFDIRIRIITGEIAYVLKKWLGEKI